MTDYYGDNYKLAEVDVPSAKLPIGDLGGRLRCSIDQHTFAAELTTSDVLYMNKIPQGAKILDVIFESPDLGTTGILNIGWAAGANGNEAADPDGFFAAQNVKAAAVRAKLSQGVAGSFKDFADECFLTVIPTENTDAATGLEIKIAVIYVIA